MGLLKLLFGDRSRSRTGRVAGDGHFEFPIVGESKYQIEIGKLAGGKTEDGVEILCAALLIPEPKNPYDPNAVVVLIRGTRVGYLSRDHCRNFNSALKKSGFDQAACEATIVGGWDRGGADVGHFGIKLNAALPFKMI